MASLQVQNICIVRFTQNDVITAYLRVPTQDPVMIPEWMEHELAVSLMFLRQELGMTYSNQN